LPTRTNISPRSPKTSSAKVLTASTASASVMSISAHGVGWVSNPVLGKQRHVSISASLALPMVCQPATAGILPLQGIG
jgi:hypothetical protein